MENLPHPELQAIKTRLLQIEDGISTFTPLTARPSILDSSYDAGNENNEDNQWLQQEIVPGLKKLKENIKLDLDVLEKFLDDPRCVNLPALSTNAPYLIAVWNEVICAPPPIVSVYKTFPVQVSSSKLSHAEKAGMRQEQKAGAKVDVVADNGRQWIRVNTVKNSRMISEFREIDSYLTDGSDDSDEEWDDVSRPSLAQTEFDNSVLRMGRTLLMAAEANPIAGTTEIPRVTLRLTRLDPDILNEDGTPPDSRIRETVDKLREMGVNVELGERSDAELERAALPRPSAENAPLPADVSFVPTSNINLDLSGLIALISDLTHAPVPETPDEVNRRFVPPQEYRDWKQKRQDVKQKTAADKAAFQPSQENKKKRHENKKQMTRAEAREGSEPPELENDINDLPRDLIQHARALTNQLLQEMGKGLLQEIHDKLNLSTTTTTPSDSSRKVVFWTTSEARDRCLRIVSKIGGVHEKRRAFALFCLSPTDASEIPLDEAEKLYWQDSRFGSQFIPLLPIRIFPSDSPDPSVLADSPPPLLSSSSDIPARPVPRSGFAKALGKICADILSQECIPHRRALPDDTASEVQDQAQDHARPAAPAAEIQRATVTKANPRLTAHTVQSMQWGAQLGWTTLTANRSSVKAILRELKGAKVAGRLAGVDAGDPSAEGQAVAAIWIIDPRSLAEGMSSVPPPQVAPAAQ